jgi:hypothetical protein
MNNKKLININYVECNNNSVSVDIPKHDWENYSTFKGYHNGVPIFTDMRRYTLKYILNKYHLL